MRELKGGEPGAFKEFALRYGSRIYDVHCWLCGDATEAEDLAQETAVAVFKGIGRFRGGSTLYTWVYRIARRIAQRHLGKTRPPCVPLESARETVGPDDTEAQAEGAMLRARVRAALKTLPDAQRESVVLHCLQGLSHRETAEVVGRPLGTVKWQIAQGLHALREALSDMGGDAGEV